MGALAAFFAKPLVKAVGVGLIILAIVAGVFWLRATWKAEGRKECEDANRAAVAKQIEDDRRLSAELIGQRDTYIRELEKSAGEVKTEIRYVPVTTGCGPSVRRAVDSVRPSADPAQPDARR